MYQQHTEHQLPVTYHSNNTVTQTSETTERHAFVIANTRQISIQNCIVAMETGAREVSAFVSTYP